MSQKDPTTGNWTCCRNFNVQPLIHLRPPPVSQSYNQVRPPVVQRSLENHDLNEPSDIQQVTCGNSVALQEKPEGFILWGSWMWELILHHSGGTTDISTAALPARLKSVCCDCWPFWCEVDMSYVRAGNSGNSGDSLRRNESSLSVIIWT